MKKAVVFVLVALMLVQLVACGKKEAASTAKNESVAQETVKEVSESPSSAPKTEEPVKEESAAEPVAEEPAKEEPIAETATEEAAVDETQPEGPFAESPILLTSGGQSAEFQMIGTLMKKLKMNFYNNNMAKAENIGNAKTLVVVVGGSSKGLGAAGLDANQEIDRLTGLLDAAKASGLSIIVMHTGGTARRGDLSDKFIKPVFTYADYAVVVREGDEDGLMAGICADNQIPMKYIDSIEGVLEVLPTIFK